MYYHDPEHLYHWHMRTLQLATNNFKHSRHDYLNLSIQVLYFWKLFIALLRNYELILLQRNTTMEHPNSGEFPLPCQSWCRAMDSGRSQYIYVMLADCVPCPEPCGCSRGWVTMLKNKLKTQSSRHGELDVAHVVSRMASCQAHKLSHTNWMTLLLGPAMFFQVIFGADAENMTKNNLKTWKPLSCFLIDPKWWELLYKLTKKIVCCKICETVLKKSVKFHYTLRRFIWYHSQNDG